MVKVTFTVDEETVSYLDRMSSRLSMPKSQIVREAIRAFGEQVGRLSDEERDRLLEVFDDVVPRIPARARAEVDRELRHVRDGRRQGGRRGPGERGV